MNDALVRWQGGAPADSLVCSTCGYGIARVVPVDRCPMCQERGAWLPVRRMRPALEPLTEGGAMNETLLTPAGFARLSQELDRLRTAGREAMAARLRQAFATDADASANADYLAAREEHAALEARIARLDRRLETARVVEPDVANGVVDLGERVRLRDLDTGAHLEYELVGPLEVDPTNGRISAESPLGRALLGRRDGEIAYVETPKRPFRYEILAIEPAA